MAHDTMLRFGYPNSLIFEYENWAVQFRPAQVTLGALVLICKSEETRFSRIPSGAFEELAVAVADIEKALGALTDYDKINYLMLMMVDPHVHFHVVPRYAAARQFAGQSFEDKGWPGPPDLAHAPDIDDSVRGELLAALRSAWAS